MRIVLVMLVGMSPAVVTETLWALATRTDHEPVIPDKLVLITTSTGREGIEQKLLSGAGRRGQLARMSQRLSETHQIQYPVGLFQPSHGLEILCPHDGESVEADAHAKGELDSMGQKIFEAVQEYTSQPDTSVIFSISGGRKSMSHLGGTAMTLLARRQDYMCHVLVKPAWVERLTGGDAFFFPDHDLENLDQRQGESRSVSQADIEIDLTDVPFLRIAAIEQLRGLGDTVVTQGFSRMVSIYNSEIGRDGQYTIKVNQSQRRASVSGRDLKAFYPKLAAKDIAYLIEIGSDAGISRMTPDQQTLRLLRRLCDINSGERNAKGRALPYSSTKWFEACAGLFNVRSVAARPELEWHDLQRAQDGDADANFFRVFMRLDEEPDADSNTTPQDWRSPDKLVEKRLEHFESNISHLNNALLRMLGAHPGFKISAVKGRYRLPPALKIVIDDPEFTRVKWHD